MTELQRVAGSGSPDAAGVPRNDRRTRQIGDTMTTPITVVQAQDQAFVTGILNRLDREVMTLRGKTESQVAALRSTVRDLEARLDRMEDDITALEERADIAPVSRSSQDDSGSPGEVGSFRHSSLGLQLWDGRD